MVDKFFAKLKNDDPVKRLGVVSRLLKYKLDTSNRYDSNKD